MRVVSLTCSNTEIVCALGAADELVGVDDHSDFPVEVVGRLPRVGPDLSIDVAKVAALRPDLVLASLTVPGHEAVIARLEKANLPFIAPAPERLDDIYADIRAIARHLGRQDRGEALVAAMQRELGNTTGTRTADASAPAVLSTPVLAPAVLIEWWPRPVIVPGARSWVTDLLTLAGGRNPLGNEPVKSRPITDAEAVAFNPDAVVICWCGVQPEKYRPDVVRGRKAWRTTNALRNDQVHSIPEAFLGRPGPRVVDGFHALRQVVARCREAAGAR